MCAAAGGEFMMHRAVEPTRAPLALALLTAALCAGGRAHALDDAPYLTPAIVDMTRLLAPPRTAADALARDLEAVRAAQSARQTAEAERAAADGAVNIFVFADVLGAGFDPARLPLTKAFFDKVNREFLGFLQVTKDCWRRPRPFEVDPTIMPLAGLLAGTIARPGASAPAGPLAADSACLSSPRDSLYSYAYPSGHATFGAMTAILLAELVPEQRTELFERGWDYGDARMTGGVHFPSDLEAGRILGTVLVALMLQNERFSADLNEVRTELREALRLPP
jgi:acid phosphatase (class A)